MVQSTKAISVLIVDDNQGIRLAVIRLLSSELLIREVDEAWDKFSALDQIRHRDFNIIILDLNFHGKFVGLEILRELRDLKISTPVLILSTYPHDLYEDECAALGAVGYVDKLTAADVLCAEVRKLATDS